jgi:hypothetical protein
MNQYITETEYAVKNLIELVSKENVKLEEIKASLSIAEAKYKHNKWDFETSDMNDDFSDAYVMGAFQRMASTHNESSELQIEINLLQALIGSRQSAIQAICGAILQISKQGISVVHRGKANAPEGRYIGSVNIRDIIWEARNQAIHFEENSFNQRVTALFQILEAENGAEFDLNAHLKQSRAKQVINLLGWDVYANYSSDMQSLLP